MAQKRRIEIALDEDLLLEIDMTILKESRKRGRRLSRSDFVAACIVNGLNVGREQKPSKKPKNKSQQQAFVFDESGEQETENKGPGSGNDSSARHGLGSTKPEQEMGDDDELPF